MDTRSCLCGVGFGAAAVFSTVVGSREGLCGFGPDAYFASGTAGPIHMVLLGGWKSVHRCADSPGATGQVHILGKNAAAGGVWCCKVVCHWSTSHVLQCDSRV